MIARSQLEYGCWQLAVINQQIVAAIMDYIDNFEKSLLSSGIGGVSFSR